MITMLRRMGRSGAIAAGFVILAGGLLGSAALYLYFAGAPAPSPATRAGGRPSVPVSVAVASRQDVPIYLTGIGTVQAYFTVDIHAKVDGELQEVLFTEGQQVRKGDVLAKIHASTRPHSIKPMPSGRRTRPHWALPKRTSGAPRRWRSKASTPSRMSTSSRARSISSRPQSSPMRP
jgi:hypothetical protein